MLSVARGVSESKTVSQIDGGNTTPDWQLNLLLEAVEFSLRLMLGGYDADRARSSLAFRGFTPIAMIAIGYRIAASLTIWMRSCAGRSSLHASGSRLARSHSPGNGTRRTRNKKRGQMIPYLLQFVFIQISK
jgi:hypothetical protein